MRLIVCTVDADPCPSGNVASISLAESTDPTLFGITADTILQVYGWGFASVLAMWALGYGVGIALGLIRKA